MVGCSFERDVGSAGCYLQVGKLRLEFRQLCGESAQSGRAKLVIWERARASSGE
jgi:hypothetical protein